MAGRVLGDAIPEEDVNLEQAGVAENEEGHQEDQSTTTTTTPSTAASSMYESPMTSVTLAADGFGFLRDPKTGESQGIVRRYTWSNGNQMSAQVISYGATITSIKIPDRAGTPEDIVMGYDNMDGYTSADNPYFGATIGRVTNRIGDSSFTLNGRLYQLTANRGKDHLHGGLKGFDKVLWKSHVIGNKVIMTHLSKDGTEGYPGNLMVSVTFELTGDNKFIIDFQATCDKPTPVNLTNHSYFNLAGHGAGPTELYNHLVTLNSDKFTTVDPDSIPTGKFRFVGGTIYDLRVPRGLGGMLKHVSGGGYDLNFCVTKASEQAMAFVARALHPDSGRVLEVYSDQPGVQFYTGNNLPDPDGNMEMPDYGPTTQSGLGPYHKEIRGKMGARYRRHGGMCFETQKYPDSVNHQNFPSTILYPGHVYKHKIIYKFGVQFGFDQYLLQMKSTNSALATLSM